MSKQSDARKSQGYAEPLKRICGTCKSYTFDPINLVNWLGKDHIVEKNKRCAIGGFAVKKTASCNIWEQKGRVE